MPTFDVSMFLKELAYAKLQLDRGMVPDLDVAEMLFEKVELFHACCDAYALGDTGILASDPGRPLVREVQLCGDIMQDVLPRISAHLDRVLGPLPAKAPRPSAAEARAVVATRPPETRTAPPRAPAPVVTPRPVAAPPFDPRAYAEKRTYRDFEEGMREALRRWDALPVEKSLLLPALYQALRYVEFEGERELIRPSTPGRASTEERAAREAMAALTQKAEAVGIDPHPIIRRMADGAKEEYFRKFSITKKGFGGRLTRWAKGDAF